MRQQMKEIEFMEGSERNKFCIFCNFYKKPKISTTLGSASNGLLEVHFHSANLIALLTMQLTSAAQRRYIGVRWREACAWSENTLCLSHIPQSSQIHSRMARMGWIPTSDRQCPQKWCCMHFLPMMNSPHSKHLKTNRWCLASSTTWL